MKVKWLAAGFMAWCGVLTVAAQTITILHTNDTHSTVMPLNKHLADTLLAGRGGFLRRWAMIEEERKEDPDLLVFDSGDFSQGSPYYSLFHGDVEVGLMNGMGVNGCTIGNHEFDYGLENMARLFRMAHFPIICSNYEVQGTPLEGLVTPYYIYKVKGVRIGVFALAPQLDGLVPHKYYGKVVFHDPVQTARRMVKLLRKKKRCDMVICLSHLGWMEDDTGDQSLVRQSRGIDLVLGGHSHTYFNGLRYVKDLDGKEVPIDQNGKHGIYVGKIVLTLKRK